MKRTVFIFAVAAALLVAWAPPGSAQAPRRFLIAAGVGHTRLSDFTVTALNGQPREDNRPAPDGWLALSGGVFYVATIELAVGAEVSWLDFGTRKVGGADESYSALPITVQGIYSVPTSSRASTFATGGLGLYHLRNDEKGAVTIESTSNVFGLNAGGGITFDTGANVSLGVDLRFHMAFSPDLKGDTDSGERSVETSDWKMFSIMGKVFF